MDGKMIGGSVAGIPVKGGIVNINSADASMIINATSGLIRTTAGVVGKGLLAGGLAIGLFALLFNGLSMISSMKMPILSLAQIRTSRRNFLGICQNEFFECICEDQELKIPTDSITSINIIFSGFFLSAEKSFSGYRIRLIDGSVYERCIPVTKQLNFLTVCGNQKIIFFREETTEKEEARFLRKPKVKQTTNWQPRMPNYLTDETDINGATANNVVELRQRLDFAFENNLEKIIESIGRDQFEKYFTIKA